jgi:hypothetical protein
MNQDVLYYVLFFKIDGTYGLFKKSASRKLDEKKVAIGYGNQVYEGLIMHTGIFKIHLFKCI